MEEYTSFNTEGWKVRGGLGSNKIDILFYLAQPQLHALISLPNNMKQGQLHICPQERLEEGLTLHVAESMSLTECPVAEAANVLSQLWGQIIPISTTQTRTTSPRTYTFAGYFVSYHLHGQYATKICLVKSVVTKPARTQLP